MRPAFYLNLEPIPGTTIQRCCIDAVSAAAQLDVIVKFDFNGVTVLAKPGDNPENIVESYRESLAIGGPHPIAADRGPK